MPATSRLPATVWMQATAVAQETTVTPATSNIKDESNIMTTHNSRSAINRRNDNNNRTANKVWTPPRAVMLAKTMKLAMAWREANSSSVARWQKFRPKSSKGAAEKKSWLKEFVAEFWLNFTKKWQKRGRRKFSTGVAYF